MLLAVEDWAALAERARFDKRVLAALVGVPLRRLEKHFKARAGRCPPPAVELAEAVRAMQAPLGAGNCASECAPKPARIVLAGGSPETGRAIQEAFALLQPQWRLEACAVSSGLAERLAHAPPAVVLLAAGTRAKPRLAAIEALAARLPGVPVILLARNAGSGEAILALAAGAVDCLALDSEPREIVLAVGQAMEGRQWLRVQTQAAMVQFLRRAFAKGRMAGLTPSETGVCLFLGGCGEKEAARQLGCSAKTISALARKAFMKLRANAGPALLAALGMAD
jgi:DNA-binding NarL/FixJ family response regulator